MVFITLAAGKGTRLGSLAKLTPKTLFQVGANQRICDTHKNLARALKITHWYLVAGKQITQIKRVVTGETNPIARVLYNPLHASPSPLYSLARTIPLLMLQDAVIANGDTLYSPKLAHSIKKQLAGVSLYLSHSQSAEADMKILLNQEGRVSQAVTPSKTGMHVSSGLVVVRGVRYRALFILAILGAILGYWGGKPGFWHQVFNGILSWWGGVRAEQVDKQNWLEVDTVSDSLKAQKHAAHYF